MSQRYRVERAEQGAINDPSPTNLNQNQFAAEFNGNLDRSNLPSGQVVEACVTGGAFTTVGADAHTSGTTLDNTSTSWQAVDSVSVTLAEDSVVEVYWGATWDETGGVSAAGIWDAIRFQLSVNGYIIGSTGWLALDIPSWSAALNGVRNAQAGTATIKVQAQLSSISGAYGAPGVFAQTGPVTAAVTVVERSTVYIIRSR